MASSATIRRSRPKGSVKNTGSSGWLADDRRATLDLRTDDSNKAYDLNKAYGPKACGLNNAYGSNVYDPNNAYKYELRPKKRVSPTRDSPGASSLYGLFGLSVLGDPFRFAPDPARARRRLGPTGPKASLCIACAKTVQQSHDKGKKDAQIVGSLASLSYLCSNFAAHP